MSKADEMFYEKEFEKTEKYIKNKLKTIFYRSNFTFINNTEILFDCSRKSIDVNGEITLDILQAINEKVKELRLGINNK